MCRHTTRQAESTVILGLVIEKGPIARRYPMSQRRNYFRVKFPVTQRPCLMVNSAQFEVLELSETGARVNAGGSTSLAAAEPVNATIQFRDGTSAQVVGCLYRRESNEVILRFRDNLPYPVIAAEQRRLLKLFPRQAQSPAPAGVTKKP